MYGSSAAPGQRLVGWSDGPGLSSKFFARRTHGSIDVTSQTLHWPAIFAYIGVVPGVNGAAYMPVPWSVWAWLLASHGPDSKGPIGAAQSIRRCS